MKPRIGLFLAALLLPQALPLCARADCRAVEIRFNPQGLPPAGGREALSPQIAVWVEGPDGKFLTDVYVTKLVGLLGLGNRPGQALLKSDFRWPYGRRPMALPIWAHRRGKSYGYIVMGGSCSHKYNPNNPKDTTCGNDFTGDPADDDTTVAYHGPVSSDEPFYCSPSGWRLQKQDGVDVVSCASSFFGSKGWYAPGFTSVYPPRADLATVGRNDSPDVARFAGDNDVAAVSSATPDNGKIVDPPVRWFPPAGTPDGAYTVKVEVNIEGDFNAFWGPGLMHNTSAVDEPHREWNHLGKQFLGQPSIVYSVPFLLDSSGRVATTLDAEGYAADFTGQSGAVAPTDMTISQSGGSGVDRLKVNTDDNGSWRVKVSVGSCDDIPCAAPSAIAALDLSEHTDTTLTVRFKVPGGEPPAIFQVKYQTGSPITAQNFDHAMPATSPTLAPPGTRVSTRIMGLAPQTRYYVAARAISRCGMASPMITAESTTSAGSFTTLSGCFIATAAYGSELEPEVDHLRRFRDRYLLTNPAGQAAVASYYALSPPLAGVIASDQGLRGLARRALQPLLLLAARF